MSAYERSAPSDLGSNLSSSLTRTLRFFRSVSKSSLSPARCTLTATGLPLYTARCTWPRDAAAIGVLSKESKRVSIGAPSSASMIATALSPPKPGTLSCRSLSTSMYSLSSTSVRVEMTWPSLTNVGPRRNSPSRINSAASVFAADTASSPPLVLPALRTLSAHLARNFHTSRVLFRADPCPRCCQPASMSSASASSSAVARPTEKRSAFHMTPRTSLTAVRLLSPSSQISGSSRSHVSSTIPFASSCSTRAIPKKPLIRRPTRRARDTLFGFASSTGENSRATSVAALTLSNSASRLLPETAVPGFSTTMRTAGRDAWCVDGRWPPVNAAAHTAGSSTRRPSIARL
mmetsp:Transcript_32852/g.56166  ORF Transcript_32852/g.56166 Transcript_32852/m.56166 type:complete len:347 (-) Transcript_32852:2-1042(-)